MPFKFTNDRSGSRRLAASEIAVGFTVLCGAFAGTASAAVSGLQLVTATRRAKFGRHSLRMIRGRSATRFMSPPCT